MTQEERRAKVAWLNRAFHAEKNAKAWMAKLERDRSLAERISRNASGGGSGTAQSNTTEDCLIRLAETQEGVQQALRELAGIREEIAAVIRGVDDLDEQTILVRHYLAYEKIDTVAEKMHYEKRTIQRKHNKALEKIVIECHP
jgi:hypothetical protein